MARTTPDTGPLGELTFVEGQTFCISGVSGQIRAGGDQGLYIIDTRVLDSLLLYVDGQEPQVLHGRRIGANAGRFTGYSIPADHARPDPDLLIDRRRIVSTSLSEEITFANHAMTPRELTVEVAAGTDFAYIFDVKHGQRPPVTAGEPRDGGLSFTHPEVPMTTFVRPSPPADTYDAAAGRLRWQVVVPPGGSWALSVSVGLATEDRTVWPTRTWSSAPPMTEPADAPWSLPKVDARERALSELIEQSSTDLASLLVIDPDAPDDAFLAAGSPWFLTLFGRDSLWAASMALPLSVSLAGQTLRVLARRQGTQTDPETEEAPGKILHEVRHGGFAGRGDLPPLYYGSMDATPLFVTLLNEAWRWGLPPDEVEALLPAAERALGWLRDGGDPDGDGFLEYQQSGERGLSNQGWKDSEDGVQFADGRLAAAPIALCEVQGYAYEAAIRGAELLAAFGRPDAQAWRQWAAAMADRFRAAFWVQDPDGAYPAIALDRDKHRVDSVTSNMGHLLATGILNDEECALVAHRLAGPAMDSGWGLRTLSSTSPRFNPLSYHGGSVWPHDTAIAAAGLAATGHGRQAGSLLRGLVAAAPFYAFRLPELLGGDQRTAGGFPLPYPAACRPQAWAAGAALLLLRSVLGVHPHVPEGRLLLRPMVPGPFGALRIEGLALAGGRLSMTVGADGGVTVDEAPDGLHVDVVTPDEPHPPPDPPLAPSPA
ncbi:MAG: glycogen debranching N-terminal domain-containing protein [Egibacteraceae bacterium]